jgi:transposase-like protein
MMPEPNAYHRHRFPTEIISHAMWLYRVFSLSLRDVELILAERSVEASASQNRRESVWPRQERVESSAAAKHCIIRTSLF